VEIECSKAVCKSDGHALVASRHLHGLISDKDIWDRQGLKKSVRFEWTPFNGFAYRSRCCIRAGLDNANAVLATGVFAL
jgi:hypothetical protein